MLEKGRSDLRRGDTTTFFCTEDLVLEKGALARVNPPLRTETDRQAIIEGLKDGTLNIIATDHAPHSREEKAKDLKDAPSGMIGLETSLALGITNSGEDWRAGADGICWKR